MVRTRAFALLALLAVLLAALVPTTTFTAPRPAEGRLDDLDPAAVWFSTDSLVTNAVAWGDWDGDGDLDLAAGNNADTTSGDADGGVCIYQNSGAWLETAASWCSFEQDWAQSVAWGDWDNDGDLDLALGNYAGPNRVYENEGGTMTLAWSGEVPGNQMQVAWGDLDGDGYLDLALANNNNAPWVYRNTGGTGLEAYWTASEESSSHGVAWGDWDNDGDPELAVANRGYPVRVYQNNNGNLTLAWEALAVESSHAVAWGDRDGDGYLDLAVANSDGMPTRIYDNDGGTLSESWRFQGSQLAHSNAWGDWNGDGLADLAYGHQYYQPIIVYESDGLHIDPTWYSNEVGGLNGNTVAWGDWNGDGDLDLAVGNPDQPNWVHENLGTTVAEDAAWSSTPEDPTYALAWGDWDGDSDLDLAVGNNGQPVRIYENDGGTLRVQWSAPASASTHSLAWGDWDGDYDLDLAVGNSAHPSQLYENENGVMTLVWTSPGVSATTSVAWGDWDADADLDLAIGNSDQPNLVYANTGGALALAWVSPEQEDTTSVAWGDWEGDGILDLAVGNRHENVRVYTNVGGDLVSGWYAANSNHITSVAWGDSDGDGDLDLAVGNNGQPNQVYENEGADFILAWTSTDMAATYGIAWGDMNNDGDLDLAAANWGQVNHLYENAGTGLDPAAIWGSQEVDNNTSVAWGDWDDDGDLDLVFGSANQPIRRYQNNYVAPPIVPNNPASIVVDRPGQTDRAYFYASAEILTGSFVPIRFRLYDHEGDTVRRIVARYSTNGGGSWQPASIVGDTTMLAASPTGTEHLLFWNAPADGASGDNIVFRLVSVMDNPTRVAAPIQRATMGAETLPFRIRPLPVGLTPKRQLHSGTGGQTRIGWLRLANHTGRPATFLLAYNSLNDWPVEGPTLVGPLPIEGYIDLPISTTIPLAPPIGTLDMVTVTAAALHNPVLFHNQAYLYTYKGTPQVGLSVDKLAPAIVEAGTVMTYTLVAHNAGPAPAGEVVITETLPANVTFAWASEGGTYSPTLGAVIWPEDLLFANWSLTMTVAVTAGCVPSGTLIVNDAYAAACAEDPTPVYGPAVTTTVSYVPPTAGFTPSAFQVEAGDVLTVSNTSQDATSYLWDWGDGFTTTLAQPQHTYAAPGTYTVDLTAANRCGSDHATAAITVVLLLEAGFEHAAFLCVGSPVDFSNTTTGTLPITYRWDFADGITSTLTHPSHTYDTAGRYVVTLLASNAMTTDTAAGLVFVLPPPTAAFTHSVSGLGVSLTNASAFANTFLWDFGDGGTSTDRNPQHTYAGAGTYTVTLEATGPCGSTVAAMPVTVGETAPFRVFLPVVTRGHAEDPGEAP